MNRYWTYALFKCNVVYIVRWPLPVFFGIAECLNAVTVADQTVVFRCGCRNCTFEIFCKKGCQSPDSEHPFPFVNFDKLEEADQNLLIGKLEEDAMVLKKNFDELCSQLTKWANGLPFSKFTTLCKMFDGYESKTGFCKMLEDRSKEIDGCSNSDDVFNILADYYSWYSFMILERIVHYFRSEGDEIARLLCSYKKKFDEYCKRSIFECPQVFSSVPRKGKVLHLKCSIPSKKCSFINSFLIDLSQKLRIYPHTLKLVSVNTGCILLVLSLPSAVAEKAFPLTSSQEMKLVSLGVQKLFCLNYYFNASVSKINVFVCQLCISCIVCN